LRSKLTATADRFQLVKGGHPAGRPISLEYVVNYDLIRNNGTISEAKIAYNEAIAGLTGSFAIDNNSLTLKTKLQGVDMPVDDLTPLLPAFGVILPKEATLEGGVLNADLKTEGTIEKMVTTGTVEITNTRLAGFDLAGNIASLASLPDIDSASVTEIKVFSSAIRLTPERIQVSSLLLIVPALGELSGSGTIDTDQSLDFKMRARLNVSGSLERIAKGGKLDIPFFVRGTAENPKFVPDVQGITGSLLDSVLSGQDSAEKPSGSDKSLGDALRKLLQKR
jgi:AsmA protein